MTDTDDINLISRLFTEGRFVQAEDVCASLTARSPLNARAFYLYGLCSYKAGHLDKAAQNFHQAVALNPKDHDSLFNLGIVQGEKKHLEEAISSYKTLLERAPHYTKALPNLAQVLMKIGRYEEGADVFNRAFALDPRDERTASLFMEFACLYLPMFERISVCNRTLATLGLSAGNRHTALLYRATAEWTVQNLDALAISLSEAQKIPPQTGDQGFINMTIYKTYLTRLLEYRKSNPALYAGQGNALYMIGDSHSLGYAALPVRMDGKDYKIDSHLLIGTQAMHLGLQEPDVRREALVRHVARLPSGAKLLFSFGEIDCRINHGIMPYAQRTGRSLEAVTADVVRNYIAAIRKITAAQAIEPVVLNVPAPHAASGNRAAVVSLFNHELANQANVAGIRLIDLYTFTKGRDLYADPKHYIDSYHLKPEVLSTVLSCPA